MNRATLLLIALAGPFALAGAQPKLDIGILLFDYDTETVSVETSADEIQAAAGTGQNPTSQADPVELTNPERVHESVRRAESYYLADLLKRELRKTGRFGQVMVVPDGTEFFDVLIAARVLRSNGYAFELQVSVADARQEVWLQRERFNTEEIPPGSFEPREASEGGLIIDEDPYAPVFEELIDAILEAMPEDPEDLRQIDRVASLRYAADIAPSTFPPEDFIREEGFFSRSLAPRRLPSEADPFFQKVRQVRVVESQALEQFDEYYASGHDSVWEPYFFWRQDNRDTVAYYNEIKDEAQTQRTVAIASGIALTALAILSAEDDEARIQRGAIALASMLVIDSRGNLTLNPANLTPELRALYDSANEKELMAEEHSNKMAELGEAFADFVEPRTLELLGRTRTFSGRVDEQFSKLRASLREVYAEEVGFDGDATGSGLAESEEVVPLVAFVKDINEGTGRRAGGTSNTIRRGVRR